MPSNGRQPAVTLDDLRLQLSDFHARYPKLQEDELFVLWFLHSYLVEDEHAAAGALVGVAGDKGVDAVLLDENARKAFLVQGKYRHRLNEKAESRAEVLRFAMLAGVLWGDAKDFRNYCKDMDPLVRDKLTQVRDRLRNRKYSLELYYVTLGRCTDGLRSAAEDTVRHSDGSSSIVLVDGRQVMWLLRDYLDGAAPPVPSVDLPVEAGGSAHAAGVIKRYDPDSEIESWVFSMTAADIAKLFKLTGIRLFARNVRGFLGNTEINRAMRHTLDREPRYFWYFNNGVTVVCDGARLISEHGREMLRASNPQLINGQQTTRTLADGERTSGKASVLVRVIAIPRDSSDSDREFEKLVSQIVEATNWQNAIRASDLMSNDRRQILIEREFRKLGYQYLRKRQTKREARRAAMSRHRILIRKEELAQAVAGCELDPAVIREGKERLFEERYYETIFSDTRANGYLSRYWLMRSVSRVARGYPERAYAKWLVLNFLWGEMGGQLLKGAERFRTASEDPNQNADLVRPLDRAISAVFAAALDFFRSRRGHGARAIDVSSFFRLQGHHREFARFWKGSRNRHRKRFARASAQLSNALRVSLD